MGNAVITSGNGGLKETAFNQIILKKVNSKSIQNEIEKLIKNPILLKKIQKFNYKNNKINFKDNLKRISALKENLIETNSYKLNFTNNNNNKRILHIANFDEKNDFRLSNINLATKFRTGLQRINFKLLILAIDSFFRQILFQI